MDAVRAPKSATPAKAPPALLPRQGRILVAGATALVSILAFGAALAGYGSRAAPTVMFGDGAELQTVGLLGGIPHATGYPTFVLLARLFAHLPFPDHAFRITYLSCCFGAATLALFVLAFTALDLSRTAALAGALVLGASFTFWNVSLRADVHSLTVFLGLLALWRTLAALRRRSLGLNLLAGFLLGLTLTVHLSFILPVAVLGLVLAWHTFKTMRFALPSLVALLAAFLLGLTPYLYLAWADTQHYAYNYLRLADLTENPAGAPNLAFDTPWERVAWLVTGRNQYPPGPFGFDPIAMARNLVHGGVGLFLFDLGPLALVFTLFGFVRGLVGEPRTALTLAAAGLLSLLGAAAFAPAPMIPVFLLPCTLVCVVFLAAGFEPLMARKFPLGIVALAATLVAPHAIRIYADQHPIGPWQLKVEAEDPTSGSALLPDLRDFHAPRLYGEQALAAIPPGSLVLAEWPEFANLDYFRVVEGQRPDLTLQPMGPNTLVQRLELWQRSHAITDAPFVFLSRPLALGPQAAQLDSLMLPMGRWIYVRRAPLMRP